MAVSNTDMRLAISACVLLCLSITGDAQWGGSSRARGRPHPLYRNQNYGFDNNFLATALLGGFDVNDLFMMRALGGDFGLNFGNYGPPRSRPSSADIKTLTLLGIIDGPDVPDAPARGGGRARGAGRAGGAGRPAGRPAPARGGEAEEAAPRARAKAPAAKKPARRPRRPRQRPRSRRPEAAA